MLIRMVAMYEHEDDGYELFRRAILERDEEAWAAIHTRYRALLIAWAYRCGATARIGEWCDDIADHAIARAWAALTPERFADFPTLSRLLAYLHTCVVTAVVDGARAQAAGARPLQLLQAGPVATPEQIVLADLDRDELWRRAEALAETAQERVVLVESFAYGLPPRAILARHPRLFADIAAVYGAKRNLIARLQRNRDLLRLNQEFVSL